LKDFQSTNSSDEKPYTKVRLELDGKEKVGQGTGEGSIDSYMNAVKDALGIDIDLYFWDEKAVYHGKGAPGYEMLERMQFSNEELSTLSDDEYDSKGQEAIAKSMVELLYQNEIFHGRGFARDITRATYNAITDACDAIYRLRSV